MEKVQIKPIWYVVIVAIIFLGGMAVGYYVSKPRIGKIETRIDTVVVTKTIRDTILIPIHHEIVRTDTVFLPLHGDTTLVQVDVPIEQKVYQTEDYKATIEGFRPNLVEMEVYQKTTYINKEVTKFVKEPPKLLGGYATIGTDVHQFSTQKLSAGAIFIDRYMVGASGVRMEKKWGYTVDFGIKF